MKNFGARNYNTRPETQPTTAFSTHANMITMGIAAAISVFVIGAVGLIIGGIVISVVLASVIIKRKKEYPVTV